MNSKLTVAAVIATKNRPRLLADRSLASIAAQSRPPDLVVIVDDSDPKYRLINRCISSKSHVPGARVVYLLNSRTPGASGAWNTALAWLASHQPESYVAILDDDDAWAEEYLEECEAAAIQRGLDMVVSGLVYHEYPTDEGRWLSIPAKLDVDELLVRNQHIQGSNLFIRLRTVLEAGAFDEALPSTTDRDLCIRLADLGYLRYGIVNAHLVHHYADKTRVRLSTPGSLDKRRGLEAFYRKHWGRMSEGQRAAFKDRARRLFDWDITGAPSKVEARHDSPAPAVPAPAPVMPEGVLSLVVGSITSPDPMNIARLLSDLQAVFAGRPDVNLKVILLENGFHDPASREALCQIVEDAEKLGMDVVLIGFEGRMKDIGQGKGAMFERTSIAKSRTMLQQHLFFEAKGTPCSLVWVLDDDCRINGPIEENGATSLDLDLDLVSHLKLLRSTDFGVVLGTVTGDPPLPFSSCIRTQLVDLYSNLEWMAAMSPTAPMPSRGEENAAARQQNPDYYYDLSRSNTSHLEMPFWYVPGEKMTVAQAFQKMVGSLPDMLRGVQVFRPLLGERVADPLRYAAPSVNRGPSTFVLDVQALREFPNTVPALDGADTRRSDMVWCLLNRFVGRRKVVQVPLAVRQDRSSVPPGEMDFEKLVQDIQGYALYSGLHDLFVEKAALRQREGKTGYGPELLKFSDADLDFAVGRFRKYLEERLSAFELGFIRISGLLRSFHRYVDRESNSDRSFWWLDLEEYRETVNDLRDFVANVVRMYSDSALQLVKEKCLKLDVEQVRDYFEDLRTKVEDYRAATPLPVEPLIGLSRAFVSREFGAGGDLSCLGIGEEGVVLTDGSWVYKYFHYWRDGERSQRARFLEGLVGRFDRLKTLFPIRELRSNGDEVALVYPYHSGGKYTGGFLDDVLTFLRECRDAGIVCRNVHPDNFIVTSQGLRLVDYGSDIRPFTEDEFVSMCRRAYFMYRFHFRSDLKALMRASLDAGGDDAGLPELLGFDHFLRALDPRSKEEILDEALRAWALSESPQSILDYGCGKGKLSESILDCIPEVVGYDPDPTTVGRCLQYGSSAQYLDGRGLEELKAAGKRFDAIICSLVLCTVGDSEFDDVIRELRGLVAESGSVLVAVCNPFHTFVEHTELQRRSLPDGSSYNSTFEYQKEIVSTGSRRTDVHRSWKTYTGAFTRAGLAVDEIWETDGTDVKNLRPSSDFLLFKLRPLPVPRGKVSLLIKTCVMEWRVVERLIRHQVEQLEGPQAFFEKVVVVDSRLEGFARQYETANPLAHRKAMEDLLADGIIDRAIYAPEDAETIRSTYLRWFGVDSTESHARNGQQLFATLYGFESCHGDYVLQIDGDLLIGRKDRSHDYFADMIDVLETDPKAMFVPLSIYKPGPTPYTVQGPTGDWRVEVRCSLFCKGRIESALPIPNEFDGTWPEPWHRAFDRFIRSSPYRSYRGGDPKTFLIHVPNERKSNTSELFDIVDRIENGFVPECQLGNVNLCGEWSSWAGPRREEPYVFVICGRNVDSGRVRRCINSLFAQADREWGAVIVDDASDNGMGDYLEMLIRPHRERITFIRNHARRGLLQNTWRAVTQFCGNPESVIITLDADDGLIGPHVLGRIRKEYESGADVTVGSMLRTDKDARYVPEFSDPRGNRGGNVWQHLRTFKKYLFDSIREDDLKIDGEWIELANDWAFMLPVVEMASCPVYIPDKLYLYEPSDQKLETAVPPREQVISRIVSRPRYGTRDNRMGEGR